MTNNVSLNVLKTTSILFFCCVVLFSNFLFAQEKKSSKKEISPSLVSTDADSPAKTDSRTIEERVFAEEPRTEEPRKEKSELTELKKLNTKVTLAIPNNIIGKLFNANNLPITSLTPVNNAFSMFSIDTLKLSAEQKRVVIKTKSSTEKSLNDFDDFVLNYLPPIFYSENLSSEENKKQAIATTVTFLKKYPSLLFLLSDQSRQVLNSERGIDALIDIKKNADVLIKY
jgi:hypothetical protein